MKTATVAEMDAQFRRYLKDSEDGTVVVTEDGKPVAVLVSITDEDEAERLSLAYSPGLRDVLDRSRRSIAAGHGIEHADFWDRIGGGTVEEHTPDQP